MRHVKGQVAYDSMAPDDIEIDCELCGISDCADCNYSNIYGKCTIGKEFITADDLTQAADELAIERLENQIVVDTIADRLRKELAEIEGGGE